VEIYTLLKKDEKTKARRGRLSLLRGEVQTPCFMPVGTQGTVKSVAPWELKELGAEIVLSNTYHLYVMPGKDYFKRYPGLRNFMKWPGPILTDSGGFQVFSLAKLRKITREGVEFSSHIDGTRFIFTPEEVIDFQLALDSDVIMSLDECLPYPVDYETAEKSLGITLDWARRGLDCLLSAGRPNALFAIVQGGPYEDLRVKCAEKMAAMDFHGYAIGGLSVGEPKGIRDKVVDTCTDILPEEKPRYLMGVGTPKDIVRCVQLGIDMFDCVIPTRYGRTGSAFTWEDGRINIRNSAHKESQMPLSRDCVCPACLGGFSRAYIRHLIMSNEILGIRLLVLHNLYFYISLMNRIREEIEAGSFREFSEWFLETYIE